MKFKSSKPTANQKTGGCAAQAVMWTVVVLGALFADVMFIALIRDALPGGIMGFGAIAGAFVTSLSIIGLVMGKTHWFRPGKQIWASWIFMGAEILVALLNVITALMVGRHQDLGILAYWLAYGAPCTPFIPVIGWIVIAFFDPAREQLHAQMEMEDEKHQAEVDYQKAAHQAQMDVMYDQLEQFTGFLQEFTNSPENREAARQAAYRTGRQVLGNITGMPIAQIGSPFIYQQQQQLPPASNEVTGQLAAISPAEPTGAEKKPESIISKITDVLTGGNKDASPLAQVSLAKEETIPEPPKTNGTSHQ